MMKFLRFLPNIESFRIPFGLFTSKRFPSLVNLIAEGFEAAIFILQEKAERLFSSFKIADGKSPSRHPPNRAL